MKTTASPNRAARRARGDTGFTLPEMLITMTLIGLISTVLAAAFTVTLRSVDGAEGRANVARAETSIDTWLPADLASTDVNATDYDAVNLDANATPCGNCGSVDLSGVNAMQLQWETPSGTTRVQYQYVKRGDEWVMERIQCIDFEPCTATTILHDLTAPADEAAFAMNPVRPVWVMDVAVPDPTANPSLILSDNAREILVTINGGGSADGAGGGANSVKLTAGGRTSASIDPDEFTVPSFVRSQSRCGGPVTLVVDTSGSIGNPTMDSTVKPGVVAFIEAFEGTPTQLQIVEFNTQARAVGPTSDWHQYFDMTDPGDVTAVKSAANSQLDAGGGTNWEEAFFHTLKELDGSTASILPNRIVFFTDGIPTLNRGKDYYSYDTSNGPVVHYNAGVYGNNWPDDRGNVFHQESWDRADVILDQHRNLDLIFVGVGQGLKDPVDWIHNPTVYGNLSANPAPVQNRDGSAVLAHLLANAPSGQVLATTDASGNYDNPETANFYDQDSFDPDKFAAAMKAAALKDCGGTLTIQTQFLDGTPVDDEFVYENAAYYDAAGTQIEADARRVTTSNQFKTGTFDFEISDSTPYFDVEIVPSELETLSGYNFEGWTCKAGSVTKTLDTITIAGGTFQGFQVEVKPNEAVSCILRVS